MAEITKQGWAVFNHELHGVTPDMLDWWWVNMEKGYQLWHPEEHKSFVWEVPPGIDTHLGATQLIEQGPPGAVMKLRARWEDPNLVPPDIRNWIIYEHVLVITGLYANNKFDTYLTHEYEAASYGTRYRFTKHSPTPKELFESSILHAEMEARRLEEFLPQLYKMWQVVKDPSINRQCCLKTKREKPSRIVYLSQVKAGNKTNKG
jgi:hypothetical protein